MGVIASLAKMAVLNYSKLVLQRVVDSWGWGAFGVCLAGSVETEGTWPQTTHSR